MRTKKDNRRYYLHRKVRGNGLKLDAFARTVYVVFDIVELPPPVVELQEKFHYAIQTEISN